MTATAALITAARRYLGDNYRHWADRYANERTGTDFPYTYTENDYNLFPRYNVLAAMLDRVEALVGQVFPDPETGKTNLKQIGLTAESEFTTGEQHPVALNAMLEERRKFIHFLDNITQEYLASVEPLPYRRRLTKEESSAIREKLFERWNFQGNYWNPVEELSPEPTIFLAKDHIEDTDHVLIRQEIQRHTSPTIFEITEDGKDAAIAFELFHPDCYETIYCDSNADWVVYGSHEGTVAFGGDWLLDCIRKVYAERLDKLNQWPQGQA